MFSTYVPISANCLFVYCLLHLCIRMFIGFFLCNINHCNDSAPCWDLDWTIKSYLILSILVYNKNYCYHPDSVTVPTNYCTRQQSQFETNLLMKQQDVCKFNVVRFISTLNLFLSRNTFLKRVSIVEINSTTDDTIDNDRIIRPAIR